MSFQLPVPWVYDSTTGVVDGDGVQQDLDALAITVGPLAQYTPTRVTTLPASPFDAQQVYYVADATNGIVWHLIYRAASASTYKWEFVGGAPSSAEITTQETTASTTFTTLATAGPTVTLPLAGDYMIAIGFQGFNDTVNQTAVMTAKLGSAAAADGESCVVMSATANAQSNPSKIMRRNGLAASASIAANYRVLGTGTANFFRRWMTVTPVRVG